LILFSLARSAFSSAALSCAVGQRRPSSAQHPDGPANSSLHRVSILLDYRSEQLLSLRRTRVGQRADEHRPFDRRAVVLPMTNVGVPSTPSACLPAVRPGSRRRTSSDAMHAANGLRVELQIAAVFVM
jgi:hypothetical protein